MEMHDAFQQKEQMRNGNTGSSNAFLSGCSSDTGYFCAILQVGE